MLVALALLALAAPQLPARAQESPAGGLADLGEGALDNDVFLPRATAVEAELARGDERLAALRADAGAGPAALERAWTEVFEAWFAAAEAAAPGDAVTPRPWTSSARLDSPWPDPDGTAGGGAADRVARRRESVEDALVRRLTTLEPERRAAWRARFGGLAEEARRAAGRRPAVLARVAGRHPGTPAAARAALGLAELELESGRTTLARGWLERAERHAALADDAELRAAVARRRELPALARPASRARGAGEAWDAATGLRVLGEVPLEDLTGRMRVFLPRPGEHAASGLAWMPDGNALVQTWLQALVIDVREARPLAHIDPEALLLGAGKPIARLDPPRAKPGWPMQPAVAADGRCVIVLHSEPSAILCFRLERSATAGLVEPRLEWARVGIERCDGAGRGLVGDAEAWPDGEAQPGPLIVDDRVLVGVQDADPSGPGRRGAWLVALDLADGAVVWSRLVARGLPLAGASLRFRGGEPPPSASQPLLRAGERALFGTHLGATALVDPLDGRLAWSLATRRRAGDAEGWSGTRSAVFPGGLLLAPADSDRLYALRAEPDLAGCGLFLRPPQPIGEALALADGDAESALVLTRSGRELALAEWRLDSGRRFEAPWLAPGESFTGSAAVSPRRAIVATQRAVYLHDRTRELFLLDHVAYPREFGGAGGPVFARNDRVLVVGPHLAWVLAPR